MNSVTYAHNGRVVHITLNRPEVRNAISRQMIFELEDHLSVAIANTEVDIILLRGAGSDFCAGEDLNELSKSPPDTETALKVVNAIQNVTRQIMLTHKLVVCVVRGWAIGAGGAWPLNADFTVWSEDSRMRFPEARHGLYASGGATWLLEQACGSFRARELLWLGENISGEQLVNDRIASSLVPAQKLEAAVDALLDKLLSMPRGSLARYKTARARFVRTALEAALKSETEQMLSAAQDVLQDEQEFSFLRD